MITKKKVSRTESTSDEKKQQYQAWVKVDHNAQFMMLSSTQNDLIGEFEQWPYHE